MGVRLRPFLVLAPLVLAVTIAGCGGGGEDESSATTTAATTAPVALDKEALIAQGDGICAEVNAAVGALGSTSSGASEQAAQVAGLYGGMVERLKALGAPAEEDASYTAFISSAEELADAEDAVKLAAAEEGEALAAAETEASSALSSFQSAATAYGFQDCAEAPAPPTPSAAAGGEEGSGEEVAEGIEGEAEAEPAPEEEAEPAPEAGGAGAVEGAGGGAGIGGGSEGGGGGGSAGGESGGIGPG